MESLCRVSYSSDSKPQAATEDTLLRIVYGERSDAEEGCLQLAIPPVDPPALQEYWRSPRIERRGTSQDFYYVCFGSLMLAYAVFPEDKGGLQSLTHHIYKTLLALGREQGYPWMLRIWNHFPQIGAGEGGMNRYQQFCEGRRRAMLEDAQGQDISLPAVTTTGSQGPGFAIYVLASRKPGCALDNPRQTAPPDYPENLGPHGPSFCRGMAAYTDDGAPMLYLSGTASIAGHQTLHPHDVVQQTREVLRNHELVMAQAHLKDKTFPEQLQMLPFEKVYLKDPSSHEAVRRELDAVLGPGLPRYFLHSDLCREDLALEMESAYLL